MTHKNNFDEIKQVIHDQMVDDLLRQINDLEFDLRKKKTLIESLYQQIEALLLDVRLYSESIK
jgi:hypothetical protein